jgi:hypothetical protein
MSAKNFTVPLNPTDQDKEVYRAADENVIRIEVQLPSGETVETRNCRVVVSLTKDAMLGLGSSLIRAALNESQERGCWEFENAEPSAATEQLGVYLHPSSCKLVLNLTHLGKLGDLLTGQR